MNIPASKASNRMINSISPAWVEGKPGTVYPAVMVLADKGANRIAAPFPGYRPGYAIAKNQLQNYLNSPRPVVFIIDFMRQPNEPLDPPNLTAGCAPMRYTH